MIKIPKFMDKKNLSKILENKYVLYFVFILAIINLFGYMVTGNFNSIVFFVLVAFLTRYFSKNMIIILTIPLVLTSVFMVGKKVKESFENASNKDSNVEDAKKKVEKFQEMINIIEREIGELKRKQAKLVKESRDGGDYDYDQAVKIQGEIKVKKEMIDDLVKKQNRNERIIEGTKKNKKEKMSSMYNKPNRIDYASTVEDAYEDLNKILGGNGIKQLTDDTQKLMKQQLQLADAMKSMSPLMEQAKGLLQGFDLKNLGSLTNVGKNLQMPVEGN
jgi:hypothetical protein